MDVGFQFEFACGNCSRTWKSAFRPYRRGQLAGFVYKLAYYLGDRGGVSRGLDLVASSGPTRARQSALDDALRLAEQRYTDCPGCHRSVCEDCWDDRARLCERCRSESGRSSSAGPAVGAFPRPAPSLGRSARRLPRVPTAARHWTGAALPRVRIRRGIDPQELPQLWDPVYPRGRFCTDCGHGFETTASRPGRGGDRAGDPKAALAALTAAVKASPPDPICASSWRSCCACSASGSAPIPSSTWWPNSTQRPVRCARWSAMRCAARCSAPRCSRQALADGLRRAREWLAWLIESLLQAGRVREPLAHSWRRQRVRRRARERGPSTASRSSGSPMPTRASDRCSKRWSTAATTGCRSAVFQRLDRGSGRLARRVWLARAARLCERRRGGCDDPGALPRLAT